MLTIAFGLDDESLVNDSIGITGCFMVLVLDALNHRFFLNEKNAFMESEHFAMYLK